MNTYWATNTDFFGHRRVVDGERLTVISRVGDEWVPERAVAMATTSADRFGWRNAEGFLGSASYVSEGISWCRGWVDDQGKQALLAARALGDVA